MLFLLGQRAAVGGSLVVNLLGESGLVLVGSGRFTGSHLAAPQPLGRALLLIGFPSVDLVRLHGISIVLFIIDLKEGGGESKILSERELQVLKLVAEGFSSREIASRIYVSTKTVETYRGRFAEKLGLKTRADVVQYALNAGLLSAEKFSFSKRANSSFPSQGNKSFPGQKNDKARMKPWFF